jgi:fluoroacetyl-CoA thioesterase
MKPGFAIGSTFTHRYLVPPDKVVRRLYPDAPEFQEFPDVFATGFMVGLMEWACTLSLAPYLEPGEGSLGTKICVTHTAATPPGLTVTVQTTLTAIDDRRLTWDVVAHDGIDEIGRGTHERTVILRERFAAKLDAKAAQAATAY